MTHRFQTLRQKKQAVQHFMVGTSFRIGMLVLTGVLMTCHVLKMSSVSTQGYQITKLQQEIQSLEQENQLVDIDIARLSSMNHIEEKVKDMQFVPIEKPVFVTVHGADVAKR